VCAGACVGPSSHLPCVRDSAVLSMCMGCGGVGCCLPLQEVARLRRRQQAEVAAAALTRRTLSATSVAELKALFQVQ
jgi:hypothetical protein